MKNWDELTARTMADLKIWQDKQFKNNYADFYLYYLETTPEHIGGILITEEAPANLEYQLGARINKSLTLEQNWIALKPILRRLPVLEYE
jgi:hypothetical protein